MNILKGILTLIIFALSVYCEAQNIDSTSNEKNSPNLKLSYNSSLIHPGISTGIEFLLKSKALSKTTKSGKINNFIKDNIITTNLSWHHQRDFHDNIYATTGWTLRRTHSNGFYTEFSPEIGLSRTFLSGTTYSVDDEGNVSIKKYNGYFYVLGCIGGGIGYDFSKIKQKNVMAFYKFNILMMFPYNSTLYMRPTMELGLICKPVIFFHNKNKKPVLAQ